MPREWRTSVVPLQAYDLSGDHQNLLLLHTLKISIHLKIIFGMKSLLDF
jgi:hypothetical protein